MSKQPLYATIDQLKRSYSDDVIQMLIRIKGNGPTNFLNGEATFMYQLLSEQQEVKNMSREEICALFSMAFGVSIKKSAEMIMQQPTETLKQKIYKIVQDKREAMGLVRFKEAFINAYTLNQLCSQLLRQVPYEQVTGQLVREYLFDEITKLYQNNWDFKLLNDAYIAKAMEKIAFLHQNDNNVELLQRFQQQQLLQLQKQCMPSHARGANSSVSTAFTRLQAVPGGSQSGAKLSHQTEAIKATKNVHKQQDLHPDSATSRGYESSNLQYQKILKSRFQPTQHIACGDLDIDQDQDGDIYEEQQRHIKQYEIQLKKLREKLAEQQQQLENVNAQIQAIHGFQNLASIQEGIQNMPTLQF